MNQPNRDKTEAQKKLEQARRESLKRAFETLWKSLGGPELQPEYQFHPERGWRFDYAYVKPRMLIAVELEGGTWVGGRHNRPKGYADDCTKYNEAVRLNWKVFRLTSDMLANDPVGHLLPIIKLIESESW